MQAERRMIVSKEEGLRKSPVTVMRVNIVSSLGLQCLFALENSCEVLFWTVITCDSVTRTEEESELEFGKFWNMTLQEYEAD